MKTRFQILVASLVLLIGVGGAGLAIRMLSPPSPVSPLPSEEVGQKTPLTPITVTQKKDKATSAVPKKPIKRLRRPLAHFDQRAIKKTSGHDSSLPPASGSLAEILSYQEGTSARQRINAFPHTLTTDDLQAVYTFLTTERVPEGMSRQSYHWLIDELMTVLRLQEPDGQHLITQLTELSRNSERDPVVRDYALQHLGHLHEQGKGDRLTIESVLWSALDQKSHTLAGTALLALKSAQQDERLHHPDNLISQALTIAENADYAIPSRIAALGVISQNHPAAAQDTALRILEESNPSTLLQITALHLLGQIPNTQDLIKRYQHAPDPRLRHAAQTALTQ